MTLERCRSGRTGLTANELSPIKGSRVRIPPSPIRENKNMIDNNQAENYGETFFSWKFPESTNVRDHGWYTKAGLAVIALLFYALFDPRLSPMAPYLSFSGPNYLFAILIILFALAILLQHQNNKEIDFKITEDGILVDGQFHPYRDIRHFYIIYQPPHVKTLYFEPKSLLNPRIPIHLADQNPVDVRETLMKFLEEDLEREHEPLSDQFWRYFKL